MTERYTESNKITFKNIVGNIILSIIKVISGVVGNSSAMVADGIHSMSDIITSVGIIIGNHVSLQPSDDEHKYGHEKMETLVCFILGIILLYVSLNIGMDAIRLLSNLEEVKTPTFLPVIVSIISIIVKEYQFYETIKVAKKLKSDALRADAWHHRSDSLSSIAVLVGVIGVMLGYKFLEPVASILVALCILFVSFGILKDSSSELLDASLGKEFENELIKKVKDTGLANNVSNLKTRKHGSTSFVELDVCIDENMTIRQGHEIAHKIEGSLLSYFENIKAVNVHVEPCAGKNCKNKNYCKENHIEISD